MMLGLMVIAMSPFLCSVTPTSDEIADTRHWAEAHLGANVSGFPFAFSYDGRPFAQLAAGWTAKDSSNQLDANRLERTTTWTDPATELEVRCQSIVYADYPVAEWLVSFKNTAAKDSGLIENLLGVDISLPAAAAEPVTVHHGRGSDAKFSDFEPLSDSLSPGGRFELASHGRGGNRGGSPSVEALPFFEIEGQERGAIFGLGWTAPWLAHLARDENGPVQVQAGLEPIHLRLHPGEEVRGMRVAVLFWKGDPLRAHNLWRRFLLAYYSPTPGGKPFTGLIADGNWGSWMTADRHIQEIRWWGDHDLPMECYWVDAGWTDMSLGWEAHQSCQEPNKALFPNGLKPLSDAAHERGMKFLLWMVPQSVHPTVGIGKEHPEWLGEPYGGKEYGAMVFHGLDHGNPDVTRYMINHFSKVVDDFGVDVFRQDGGNLWPEDKDPDRMGANQMHYVQGAYDFWDGLLKAHPNMLIDNCAEGGRKIDLETIRRSIVLWRSDSQASGDFDPASTQGFSYGLLQWTPLCGAPAPMMKLDAYGVRSAYCPALLACWPMKNVDDLSARWSGMNLDLLRKLLNEYVAVRPCFFGDFYPLTPYSIDSKAWLAWQFDRPDLEEGLVQAFRRADCEGTSQTYKLHGLDAAAVYTVTDLDEGQAREMDGKTLMETGLTVNVPGKPGAATVTYKKVR